MLKPTYRNRGGKMMQKIQLTFYVGSEDLISVIAHMIHMEKKITKSSVEEELRATLWAGGSDKTSYLHESIDEWEREQCLEQGKAKATELFPEFFH